MEFYSVFVWSMRSGKVKWQFQQYRSVFYPAFIRSWRYGNRKNDSDLATVQIHDSNYIDEATEQIKAFSDSFAKASDTLWTFSYKELLTDISSQITLVSAILTAIAVMSLIVGGINIMNIMLVTVTERKKKSVSAKRSAQAKRLSVISFWLKPRPWA